MDETVDELAGIVDLFGGMTRAELECALSEAAYRADGQSVDSGAVEEAVETALESFALVEYEPSDTEVLAGDSDDAEDGAIDSLLVAGPTAFPSVPRYAEDVPHILGIERRRLDRNRLAEQVHRRYETAVTDALESEIQDSDTLEELLEVSYDLEAWGPIDLEEDRRRLEEALEEGEKLGELE